MYMYMYLQISVPTVQMLLKTNAPVHVKPERQITLISYNYNIHMQQNTILRQQNTQITRQKDKLAFLAQEKKIIFVIRSRT